MKKKILKEELLIVNELLSRNYSIFTTQPNKKGGSQINIFFSRKKPSLQDYFGEVITFNYKRNYTNPVGGIMWGILNYNTTVQYHSICIDSKDFIEKFNQNNKDESRQIIRESHHFFKGQKSKLLLNSIYGLPMNADMLKKHLHYTPSLGIKTLWGKLTDFIFCYNDN